jgi:hypothetical protein
MKKTIRNFCITLLLSFGLAVNVFADHNLGGQITYKYVSANVFKIRLTLYSDCAGIPFSYNSEIINVKRQDNISDCSSPAFTYNAVFIDTNEVTDACTGVGTSCNGGAINGVREWIYEVQVNLGAGNKYEIWWTGCCRSNFLINYPYTVGTQTVHTTMFKGNHPTNNSPQIGNKRLPIVCVNSAGTCYNQNAFDIPDAGSTSKFIYELVPSADAKINLPFPACSQYYSFSYSTSPYLSGYSATNPFGTGLGLLNPNTGLLSIPTLTISNFYEVVIKITEIATNGLNSGTPKSIVYRDFNVTATNAAICNPAGPLQCSYPPAIVTGAGYSTSPDTIQIREGSFLNLVLNFNEPGKLVYFDASNYNPNLSPNITFLNTVLTGNGTSLLSISITGTIPIGTNDFDLFTDIKSDCPFPSRRSKPVHIKVIPCPIEALGFQYFSACVSNGIIPNLAVYASIPYNLPAFYNLLSFSCTTSPNAIYLNTSTGFYVFDPSIAGVGTHNITVSYTNCLGQVITANGQILVPNTACCVATNHSIPPKTTVLLSSIYSSSTTTSILNKVFNIGDSAVLMIDFPVTFQGCTFRMGKESIISIYLKSSATQIVSFTTNCQFFSCGNFM